GIDREEAQEVATQEGQEIFPQGSPVDDLKDSAEKWETWVLVGLYFTSFGGFLAITGWLPTFWIKSYGLPLATAGLLTMAYSVLASLIRVPGGSVSDEIGAYVVLFFSFSLMSIGALVIFLDVSYGITITGTICACYGKMAAQVPSGGVSRSGMALISFPHCDR
ncbi:MAG: MFS transporter, partial [Balneolaceae bacterium]|nr:MFS transporter [Balneolaceae bacterium]